MGEKTEVFKWFWLWVAMAAIVVVLGLLFMPVNKAVERVTFETSFQYSEAKKEHLLQLKTALAEVEGQLQMQTDPGVLANLRMQETSLKNQIKIAEGK